MSILAGLLLVLGGMRVAMVGLGTLPVILESAPPGSGGPLIWAGLSAVLSVSLLACGVFSFFSSSRDRKKIGLEE